MSATAAPSRAEPLINPPSVSMLVSPPSRRATQRVTLPQAPTSPPSLLKMRILTSARVDGSSRISWSQPMPVFSRLAIARARASSISTTLSRASKMTKSLPRPCILWKRTIAGDLGSERFQVHHGLPLQPRRTICAASW